MQIKQDEKLDEVRAILQRLQRISTGTEDDDAAASPPAASASQAPLEPAPPAPGKRAPVAIIAAAVGLALVAGVGLMLWPAREAPPAIEAGPATSAAITVPAPPAAQIPQAQPSARDAERLAQAQSLMDEGKIAEARHVLLADLADRTADAALLLARSYDPNALQVIAAPNAPADAEQAERWYRRWSEMAGRDGLVMDQDRLDRIIRAMR